MAGLSASGLKTQIRSYTEVSTTVLSDSVLENIILITMNDHPSQDDIEEVIVDASSVKGHSQPIIVHSKAENKPKSGKTTAA